MHLFINYRTVRKEVQKSNTCFHHKGTVMILLFCLFCLFDILVIYQNYFLGFIFPYPFTSLFLVLFFYGCPRCFVCYLLSTLPFPATSFFGALILFDGTRMHFFVYVLCM